VNVYAAIAPFGGKPLVLGININCLFLDDKDADTFNFSNGNDIPVYVTFANREGINVTYNGESFESLQLAPGEQFIGLVKGGNIQPQHGQLTPIPLVPAPPLPSPVWGSNLITRFAEDLQAGDVVQYQKDQRKELKKIYAAKKALRAAKKLSKEQEEDL
jgi:hypothetical protein